MLIFGTSRLAGLAAAAALAEGAGRVALAEAADDVGGRVRTDVVRGFQLDRGFQILITAYPEARRLLDYGALELRDFYAGALVWARDGRFHRVADPLRHPLHALLSLFDPVVGSVADKLLVGLVRALTVARPDSALLSDPDEEPIASRLRSLGFSPAFVDAFFRPFLAGIFFDPLLRTSSRLFSFVFKCLALGPSALPARGIAAVPRHLARRLPASTSILLRSRVARLLVAADADAAAGHPHDPDRVVGVELEDGRRLLCSHGVILATDGPEAWNLLRRAAIAGTPPPPPSLAKPPRSTVCIYFEADADPARRLSPALTEPILLLNGSGNGIVNNMFFPTSVSPSYAPPGKILASVSLVGLYDDRTDAELEATVRDELADWLGADVVASWTHLRTYRIRFAQPDQSPPTDLLQDTRLSPGLYVCGDHRYSATFDGALASGRRAAQDLLADLDRNPPS